MSKKRQKPTEFRIAGSAGGAMAIIAEAKEGDEKKLPSFSGNAYTGAPMRPQGWWDPIIIDLGGVKIPSQHRPVLRQHDHEQLVGHTKSVKAGKDGILIDGVFSGQQEHVDKVVVPAKNGFQWQLSIGANPIRTEFLEAGEDAEVNGRTVTGPLVISRETELGEISFVPLGADGETSAKVTASQRKGAKMSKNKVMLKWAMAALRAGSKAAKYSDEEVDKMSEDDAKTALKECMKGEDPDTEAEEDSETEEEDKEESKSSKKNPIQAGINQARAEMAAELRRQTAITATVQKFGVQREIEIEEDGKKMRVDIAAHAIEKGWNPEKVELHLLRAARPGSSVGIPGGLAYSTNKYPITDEVLTAAIFQAGRHEMQLGNDDFYFDQHNVNGVLIKNRRVPQDLERRAKQGLNFSDQAQQIARDVFKERIGLQQLFVCAARQFGYNGPERIRDESEVAQLFHVLATNRFPIQAEGSSTANIPNILANVLNKFMLQGYLFVEQTWRDVGAIRPVNDFKPTKSINLLGGVEYEQVAPTGELANATLSDQAFANQADQYGKILTISRKNIINDDLGMLTTAPVKIGQGAGLKLNSLFWTTFLNAASALADDGNAFFANTAGKHGTTNSTIQSALQVLGNANLIAAGAGSALASGSLQTAKQMFDKQIDPNGNPLGFDGLVPILLFPPELWLTAIELVDPSAIGLVYGGATTSKQPNINLWKGRLKPCMSRYLSNTDKFPATASATAWYILFAPIALAMIEVAFLNGVDTPTVQTAGPDFQFDRLGISIRGILDFGVNLQNYRAAVKSPGA